MEIVRIFASDDLENKGGLFAIRYKKRQKDEYTNNLAFWLDANAIQQYLKQNSDYLKDDFFSKFNCFLRSFF